MLRLFEVPTSSNNHFSDFLFVFLSSPVSFFLLLIKYFRFRLLHICTTTGPNKKSNKNHFIWWCLIYIWRWYLCWLWSTTFYFISHPITLTTFCTSLRTLQKYIIIWILKYETTTFYVYKSMFRKRLNFFVIFSSSFFCFRESEQIKNNAWAKNNIKLRKMKVIKPY